MILSFFLSSDILPMVLISNSWSDQNFLGQLCIQPSQLTEMLGQLLYIGWYFVLYWALLDDIGYFKGLFRQYYENFS